MVPSFTKYKTIREAAVLTTSYVTADEVLGEKSSPGGSIVAEHNQLHLYIDFTLGSLTSSQVKVEFSIDNENWFQETTLSVSSGTQTVNLSEYEFTASGQYRVEIPIKDRYIRVSAKGTGTVTGSSMEIKAVTGNV